MTEKLKNDTKSFEEMSILIEALEKERTGFTEMLDEFERKSNEIRLKIKEKTNSRELIFRAYTQLEGKCQQLKNELDKSSERIWDEYELTFTTASEQGYPEVTQDNRSEIARELAEYDNLIFLCGHYEGVDQRVLDEIVDEDISIGDYVLTGGELPACIIIDAVSRLKEGVLADSECYENESHASGILEYPQYTKPRVFLEREVPEILLSGDHKKIDRWRLEEAVKITKERRPDLLELHPEIEESLKPKEKKKRKTQNK
jgi:tRNA G37 N-methylase TrmD